MKIRTDFVTNSSSSSFVLVNIKSKKLVDIFAELQDLIEEDPCLCIDISNDGVQISQEECFMEVYCQDAGDFVDLMAQMLDYEFSDAGGRYKGDGKNEEWNNDEDYQELEEFSEITQALMSNKEKIVNTMESARAETSDSGWGGDDESRFYENSYSEEMLQTMKENIASQNNCTVEEVDEDMFCDYVANETSISETIYEYDGKTKKIKTSSDYYLL